MARTPLTVHTITRAGIQSAGSTTPFDTVNGMECENRGDLFILVSNSTGVSNSLIIEAGPGLTFDGVPQADYYCTVPNGSTELCGPFPARWYTQADGKIYLKASAALNIQAYRLP